MIGALISAFKHDTLVMFYTKWLTHKPLSSQGYKWVPRNCQRSLMKCSPGGTMVKQEN